MFFKFKPFASALEYKLSESVKFYSCSIVCPSEQHSIELIILKILLSEQLPQSSLLRAELIPCSGSGSLREVKSMSVCSEEAASERQY